MTTVPDVLPVSAGDAPTVVAVVAAAVQLHHVLQADAGC